MGEPLAGLASVGIHIALLGLIAAQVRRHVSCDRWLEILLATTFVILFTERLSGLFGFLDRPERMLLPLALAAFLPRDTDRAPPEDGPDSSRWRGVALVALASLGALIAARWWHALTLPSDSYDSLLYHLPKIDWIAHTGSITTRGSPYWFYPQSSHLLAHWFAGGFGDDSFAFLANTWAMVILLLSLAGIGSHLGGCGRLSWVLGACLILSTQPTRFQLANVENDLFLAAFWVAAVRLALMPSDDRRSRLLMAGCLGVVLSTKYTGLFYATPALFVLFRGGVRELGGRSLAAALVLLAVLGLPDYGRNLLATGDPVHPALAGLLHQSVPDRPLPGPTSCLLPHLGRPEAWGLLGRAFLVQGGVVTLLLPILALAGSFGADRSLLSLIAASGVAYLLTPTAAENLPGTLNQLAFGYSPVRFSLPGLFLLAPLAAAGIETVLGRLPSSRRMGTWTAFGIAGLLLIEVVDLPGFFLLTGVTMTLATRIRSRVRRTAEGLLLAILALALALALPRLEDESARIRWTLEPEIRDRAMEDLHPEAVAPCGIHTWVHSNLEGAFIIVSGARSHPFSGRGRSNRVVDLEQIGALPDWERLIEGRDVYLVVCRSSIDPLEPDFGTWPADLGAMEAWVQDRLPVYQDDFGVIHGPLAGHW